MYCVRSPSLTQKSRADVCLRAHVDDEDPLTRVGLRIVGGEVVGQRRLSDTTLGIIDTWSPSDNITIEHRKGLQSLSIVTLCQSSHFHSCHHDSRNLFCRMFYLVVPHSINLGAGT